MVWIEEEEVVKPRFLAKMLVLGRKKGCAIVLEIGTNFCGIIFFNICTLIKRILGGPYAAFVCGMG